jgi:hypothetical protein
MQMKRQAADLIPNIFQCSDKNGHIPRIMIYLTPQPAGQA